MRFVVTKSIQSFFGFLWIVISLWIVRLVWYILTILVGGGFLKRLSMNAILLDSGGQEKVTFYQVSSFSVSFS